MLTALILASSLYGYNADRNEDSYIYSTGDDYLYQYHSDGSTTVIYEMQRTINRKNSDDILYEGYDGYRGGDAE